MGLEYTRDLQVKVVTESDYPSLYSWSLQEFDKDDKPVGRPQVPWEWSLGFEAAELQHSLVVNLLGDASGSDGGVQSSSAPSNVVESIRGVLRPDVKRRENGIYSLFGSNRTVSTFDLRILRLAVGEAERCSLSGFLSYSADVDFEDHTVPDWVGVELHLAPTTFDRISHVVSSGSPQRVSVLLTSVSGFYSEWTPSVRTSQILILSRPSVHGLVVPDGFSGEIPTLGKVGEFEVHFSQCIPLQTAKVADAAEADAPVPDVDAVKANGESVEPLTLIDSSVPTQHQQRVEQLLSKVKYALYGIFIALVFHFFK